MISVQVSFFSSLKIKSKIKIQIKKRLFNIFIEIGAVHYEADEAVKQKKFEDLKKDVIPFYLSKLDAIAKENNGYLALGKVYIILFHSFLSNNYIEFKISMRKKTK